MNQAKAEFATLRLTPIKIAARIVESAMPLSLCAKW